LRNGTTLSYDSGEITQWLLVGYLLRPSIKAPVPESFGEQSHQGLLLDITKGPAIRFILLDYQVAVFGMVMTARVGIDVDEDWNSSLDRFCISQNIW
jgi:hypothetical protein